MSYTYSPSTLRFLPTLFRKLGIDPIPYAWREESFRYVGLVREAIENRLRELETGGIPDEIYSCFRFRMEAPGWSRDIGLFGLVTRWVCFRWLAEHYRQIDPIDCCMNEKYAEKERRFLLEDWGIGWRSECGIIGCEPGDCRCGSRD